MGRNHAGSHLLKCRPHISLANTKNKFWCFSSSSYASIEGLCTLPWVSKNTMSHLRLLPKRRRRSLMWVSRTEPGDIPITSCYTILWCTCVYMQLTRIINACQILLMFQTSYQKYNVLQKQIKQVWAIWNQTLRNPNPFMWPWKGSLAIGFVRGSANMFLVEICFKNTYFFATMSRM